MGGVVSDLFGGGKSKNSSTSQSTSSSYNQAYNYLNGALSPTVSAGTNAASAESALLTGGTGSDAAYENYLNSTGYKQALAEGEQGVTNNAAVNGVANSGATAKALTNYGVNAANTTYQNYLSDLNTLANTGNAAASTISGAGTVSNSQSTGSSTGSASNTSGIIPGLFG